MSSQSEDSMGSIGFDGGELIERFAADCELRGLTPESIRGYKGNLRIVSKFLNRNGLTLLDLDRQSLKTVLNYLTAERGVTPQTVGDYFSALSSLYKYLIWEKLAEANPILPFRERYLSQYKNSRGNTTSERKLIKVSEMATLINSVLDPRGKAIITLLAKTGVRRGELIDVDLDDVDWGNQRIKLKPKAKRSNRIVFFDDETAIILRRWLRARENYNVNPGCGALFVGEHGGRLGRNGVYYSVVKHAERVGLHDSSSSRLEDHFSPHCCRHWFTTHLRRNGLSREFLKELRGDSRSEAVDIYDHIDLDELRQGYLAAIPRLGII